VVIELELNYHARDAFERRGAQFVNSAYGVDRLFDWFGDARLGFLGRRARQKRGYHHCRHFDPGEEVNAQPLVGKPSQHHQHAHEHGGEHRAAHTEVGKNHDCFLKSTAVPSARRSTSLMATSSPSFRPRMISIWPPATAPVVTSRAWATP